MERLDEFKTKIVDGGFGDSDEHAIEDDCSEDGDLGVAEKAWWEQKKE